MFKDIKGLWIPLVTPMYQGVFDHLSLKRLMSSVDSYVGGYVPCLSSGEGESLSNTQWEQVIKAARENTKKPIFAGIKRIEENDIIYLAKKAKNIGCEGIIFPVPYSKESENLDFFARISKTIDLPIIIYNTETAAFKTIASLERVSKIENIVAIKDSSMNPRLFRNLVKSKKTGKLSMSVLQGMEHMLYQSKGADGFLISLLNIEPKLCWKMYKTPSKETNDKILNLFWKYNLGGDWYITLKALLFAKGIIRSAEQVNPPIKP